MFWNSLIDFHTDQYCFKFFSTEDCEGVKADECILINYGWTVFEQVWQIANQVSREIIIRVAEKDQIWEIYNKGKSEELAGSWIVLWTIFLELFHPIKVIIWNGHHVPEAALVEVCDFFGIEVIFAERGPLGGTFALDKSGINFLSKFVNQFEQIEAKESDANVQKFAQQYFDCGTSNWDQPERFNSREEFINQLGIPAEKTILFFPSQVDRDSNSKLFSPHFSNTFEAILAVTEWCNAHSDSVHLLVKKHPMQEKNELFDDLTYQSGQSVKDVHIFDCIQYCHAVVSVNSSSAVEAALLGKPVMLLGQKMNRIRMRIAPFSYR